MRRRERDENAENRKNSRENIANRMTILGNPRDFITQISTGMRGIASFIRITPVSSHNQYSNLVQRCNDGNGNQFSKIFFL